ncbi:MAG: 4-hydroxy-3-methylbut-2-enyl diphosphate reductase [Candidatus Omnitrophica bacterium]|nr:4-hydroxy-3-methylbut-2-enyl diphosphate reductase [Candidatus Omnitrophota bacterium]
MEIYLAHTQGFCAGVARAIDIVNRVYEKYGVPLFVFHEIVHNTKVVENFKKKGIQFVDDLADVPDGARIIFSAHGVSPQVIEAAKEKNLVFFDATCPLVRSVHNRAKEFSRNNIDVVLIGHKNHQEVIGTKGYIDPSFLHIIKNEDEIEQLSIDAFKKVGYVTQTTLSLDDTKNLIVKLKERFSGLIDTKVDDVCYATQNRQNAIKELCGVCDVIIICGSANSSNSNRLKELAEKCGVESYLIDSADEINLSMLKNKKKIGISSGASVPESVVLDVIDKLKMECSISKIHVSESPEKDISFSTLEI